MPAKFSCGKGVATWMRGYSAGTRKEKLQTDIANMDLRVVLLLALLGNITVRQSSVNAKILNGPI